MTKRCKNSRKRRATSAGSNGKRSRWDSPLRLRLCMPSNETDPLLTVKQSLPRERTSVSTPRRHKSPKKSPPRSTTKRQRKEVNSPPPNKRRSLPESRCSSDNDQQERSHEQRSSGPALSGETSATASPHQSSSSVALQLPSRSALPLSSSSIAQHPSTSAESPSTSDDAPSLSKTGNEPSIILKESALNGYAKVFSISNTDKTLLNIELFLNNCMPLLTDTLKVELDSNQCVKFQLFLEARFTHPTDELTVNPQNFKSCSKTLYRSTTDNEINQTLTEDISSILTEVGEFEGRGSGWTLTEICELQLRISKCSLYTSSGKGYIPLPPIIAKRKAVINPKNIENDVFCFKYSIISKLYTGSANNPTIREIKAIDHNYDFNSLPFPMPITAISKFETKNPGTSVNLFILDNNDILHIRIVDSEAADHFDLLYIPSDATSGHYAYIRDFNRLVRPQIIGTDRRSNRSRLIICKRCFTHKRENQLANPREWLAEHRTYCKTTRPCQIKITAEGNK